MNSKLFRTVAPALAAHFSTDMQLAESYVRDFVDLRRSAVRAVFDQAVARGQLRGDLDINLIYDALTGPLFYRAIARGEHLDRKFVEAIIDALVSSTHRRQAAPALANQPATDCRHTRWTSPRRVAGRRSRLTVVWAVCGANIGSVEVKPSSRNS